MRKIIHASFVVGSLTKGKDKLRFPFRELNVPSVTLFFLMRLLSMLCAMGWAVLGVAAEADFPLADAKECHPPAGLPNFLAKAQTPGAAIKVAYLGGSITAQPGWRVKSLAYFKSQYPQANFVEINAAIGGTGSDLGVFRLQQDVLAKKPDLLFVEFAVNDGGAAPETIMRNMEGIVRQTWKAFPQCDICFVYTLVEGMAPTIAGGKFQRSASAMELVAEHYQIPTIHFGLEVSRLSKEGKVLWKAPLPKTPEQKAEVGDKIVFAPDSVHPHVETGHQMYLEAIQRSWPAIQKGSTTAGEHRLAAPLRANNSERAQLVSIAKVQASAGVEVADMAKDPFAGKWSVRLPAMLKLTKPGQSLEFKFKGTHCAIYDVIGPAGGKVAVTLDQRPAKVYTRFDAYCVYDRLSTFTVGTDLPDEVHQVKIELLPEAFDKAAILSQNKNKIDKPERFEGRYFYPGAVLILGEMAP